MLTVSRRRSRLIAPALLATFVALPTAASAAGPRGQLTPDRVAAPEGREAPELATERSRTWVKDDGAHVTRVWNRPVNVKQGGEWKAIDNRLHVSASGGFVKGDGGADLRVPASAAEPLRLRDGDRWIELRLLGSDAPAKVAGSTATYAGAAKGVDLKLTAFDDAIKEDLILSSSGSQSTFAYDVKLSEGLELRVRQHGGAEVVDGKGDVAFVIPAPIAQDKDGAIAVGDDATLTYDEGRLEVSLSKRWLQEPGRAFPVVLDPSAVVGASGTTDTFLDQGSPTTSYSSGGDMWAGREAAGYNSNTLIKFNLAGQVPAAAFVNEAFVNVWPKYETASTGTKTLSAHRVLADWDASATWNKRNASTNWTAAGGDYNPGALSTQPGSAYAWKSFQITDLATAWLDGSAANQGILIGDGASTVDRAFAFASSEWVDSAARPFIQIDYFPRTGEQANSTIQKLAISDRQTLGVNVAGGNLLLESQDFSVAAKGPSISVKRYFNSLDTWTGQFGKRGRMSIANDLVLYECDGVGSRCLVGPSGYRLRFTRNSGGTTYKTPPGGGNVSLTRTGASSGNFTLTDNASGTKWNFFDNSFSFNNSVTDRYGNTVWYAAAGSGGSLSKITDANGREYPVTTDSSGRVTKIAVPTAQFAGGVEWQYGYNAGGDLTTVTDPEGYVTTYTYTGSDLTKITDGRNNETHIAYEAQGRVSTVTRKLDAVTANDVVTTYSYPAVDSACDKTSGGGADPRVVGKTIVTDPNNNATTYCYAHSGAVVKALKTVNGNTQITDNTYTSVGNLSKITGFSGTGNFDQQFSFSTTAGLENNLEKITGGEGEETSFTYLAGGGSDPLEKYRVDYAKDPQNNEIDYRYDVDGNVDRVDNSAAGAGTQNVELNYNTTVGSAERGVLNWSKDGNGNQTTYDYDGLQRLNRITTASPTLLPDTTFTYDGLSRIKTVTDGRGKVTTYGYDKLDRITTVSDNGSITQTFGYDANGNNTTRTEPGKTSSYTYDKLNRKTAETFPGSVTNGYTWDKNSNLKTLTDSTGTATYTYDEVGRMKSINAPGFSGNDTTSYAWTEPTTSGATTSWRTATLPGGGKIKETFDRSGKLTETLVTNSSAVQKLKRTYGYVLSSDPTRKRAQLVTGTEQLATSDPLTNKSYAYDASGRLVEAKAMDAAFAQTSKDTFDYDGAGNRLRRTRVVGSTTSYLTAGFNAVNQQCWKSTTNVATPTCGSLTQTYTYDAAGNTTAGDVAATYDDKNRLASLGGVSLAHLSPTNWEQTATGTTSYRNHLLGVGRIIEPTENTNYQRSPDDGSVVSQVSTSKRWYVTDQIGSTIALIEGDGTVRRTYAYDTDGNATTTGYGTGANPGTFIKFAGGHDIGNGLYHFGQRYYQPSIGRWTQQDPLMQPGDLGQANRYGYVANDPLNATDPTGTISLGGVLKAGGKVLPGVGCGYAIYKYSQSDLEGFPNSEERVKSETRKVLQTGANCIPGVPIITSSAVD